MKLILMVFTLLIVPVCYGQFMRGEGDGQPSRATEIARILHCLTDVELNWLGDSAKLDRAKALRVGLRHDRQTYPGKDFIFVVVLESSTKGDVFELTREDHKESRSCRIQNNGQSKIGHQGMEWPGEILGGIWTHEYVERNVRLLLKGPKITIPARAALKSNPRVTCSSYVAN